METTYEKTHQIFETKVFNDEEYEVLIEQLADIYIENCGISKSFRTLAHEFAIFLIGNHKKLDFGDSVVFFDKIMDEKSSEHREYDIVILNQEEMIAVFEIFKKQYSLKLG
jgi:hypothetical protein